MKARVAICQYDIAWRDVDANLARLDDMLAGVEADLVVLPEMFQTGWTVDADDLAETMSGRSIDAMRRWAARADAAVAGSIAVRDEGGVLRNRMLLVEPSGRVTGYDKRHLFAPGGEAALFSTGDERVVVERRGVRYMLLVCYDLRFPVWSRNRGDYDVAVYSALWPAARRRAWATLLAARAIENQCYTIGVNRTGDEPTLSYAGDSRVVDFRGDVMIDAASAEGVFTTMIDTGATEAFKRKFPAWSDADLFEITK